MAQRPYRSNTWSAVVYEHTVDRELIKRQKYNKLNKGVWGMPRLSEAKKDVISCEKLRGGAHTHRSAGVRMGQPSMLKACYPKGGEPGELKHLSTRRKRKQK